MTEPPPGEASDGAPRQGGRHRTGWIVATVMLVLVVVGLLIWGISTQSDLDSANTTIESQQEAAKQAGAQAEQAGEDAKKAYDSVSSDLAAEKEFNDQLKADVSESEKQKADADQHAAKANNEADKANADADAANAKADAATSCAKGAINAFGSVFQGDSLKDGVDQAVTELQNLKGTCDSVLSGG